jgi:CRP-like cAMP-binding protein
MSLAVLIELESFVQILPTYLIPMIARVLLQTNNWTKTVTSLGVEKKIQLCLLLLRKNGIQQRQNLFLVVFTRIVSCIVIKNEESVEINHQNFSKFFFFFFFISVIALVLLCLI